MKKISVVVPTYNQATYLPACLDSIWFQDYDDLEVVVVNDGSTDDTVEVLERYQSGLTNDQISYANFFDEEKNELKRRCHERYRKAGRDLTIIEHEQNRGLATALNSGFRICQGEYCTYVPSDDICYPSMFSEMARAIQEKGADFVYADMFIVDDQGRIIRQFQLPDYSFESCFQDWYLCGVAKLYRRALHERWGYYDEKLLAHDHELFLRFAMNGAYFCHVPRVLMAVRDHSAEREIYIHSPENWNRLIEESKALVKIARDFSERREICEPDQEIEIVCQKGEGVVGSDSVGLQVGLNDRPLII